MTTPEKLEPKLSALVRKDTANTFAVPLSRDVLATRAATRTADQLTDLAGSARRIAEALEGLLLVLDTRAEVSNYLTRKPRA